MSPDTSRDTKRDRKKIDQPEREAGGGAGENALPAIDFSTFVLSLSTSALYQMGLVPPPAGGEKAQPDLALARHSIDVLEMLREKTRGNLDSEEAKLLDGLLYELHTRFVEIDRGQSSSDDGGC
ncbi:MAG: DUF1844 domain-containing protein [Deltaproteobacteria bacterium]|nr:DUF1844 domain-containing protein [Deltaproteobacteria bacterium]MBW2419106.1 DUF1844 domain-containing protein [Deltaproteobacteria bacterium]